MIFNRGRIKITFRRVALLIEAAQLRASQENYVVGRCRLPFCPLTIQAKRAASAFRLGMGCTPGMGVSLWGESLL